ncbi:MAG TPA: biotin/lipoyl-containing protein [Terriglobales bacterium]
MRLSVTVRGKVYRIELQIELRRSDEAESNSAERENISNPHRWTCLIDGRQIAMDVAQVGPNTLSILQDGRSAEVRQERVGRNLVVFVGRASYEVAVQDARSLATRKGATQGDTSTQKLTAAMPGKVMRVLAGEGDEVVAGQGIVVIEAMKMQNEVRAPKNGILKKLLVQPGTNVNAGDVLAVVE